MAVSKTRTGARGWAKDVQHACKLSRTPGFRAAIEAIFGGPEAADIFAVWDPFCVVVDALVGVDNWFAQVDYHQEVTGTEDIAPV